MVFGLDKHPTSGYVRGMVLCLPRWFGCRIAVHSLWQKTRSWESWQCCSFHTVESKEDVWPSGMGYPGLLEQSGLKTINPVIVLQLKKKYVYKSAPCLALETVNAQPHAGTNTNYKTWHWFLFIPPPFSVYRSYFTSMEAEACVLLAPIHVAVCSCIREGRVTLLYFPVTSVSQIKDRFAVGRCYINFFCLSSWKCRIMTKNVYHKNKTFLVSPAKPMVTEKELNGTDPRGCNVDKLPLLRHWKKGATGQKFSRNRK